MEVQTENEKKKVPLSTGLKWLRLVCMAVVFGIIILKSADAKGHTDPRSRFRVVRWRRWRRARCGGIWD